MDSASPANIPTPCVRNCCLDDQDICIGCHRSLSEIIRWHDASDEEKREILSRCRLRGERRRQPLSVVKAAFPRRRRL